MKMTEDLRKAAENMQAGVITADGFLGQDSRDLASIIQHDEEEFRRLGLDWEGVAQQLRVWLQAGSEGLGEPITLEARWLVRVDETRGMLPSPWQDGIFHKVNAEVELLAAGKPTGKKILYNELCIHLLEKHHFLQGRGSPFRLEPANLKAVLS